MKKLCTSLPLLILFLLCFTAELHAQDPVFSQYFAAPIQLNPALTGFQGGTTVHMNYRDQWFRVAGRNAKFITQSIAADVEMPCIQSAFGLVYTDNVEGEGYYRWQSSGLSYAWRSRTKDNNLVNQDFEISLGMRGTYNWRSLDWNQLVFSDQLDAIHGNVGPTALDRPADLRSGGRFFDFDAGGVFLYKHRGGRNRITVGTALSHLVRIDNSIEQFEDTLPIRTTIHASYVYNVSFGGVSSKQHSYDLVPMIKVDAQRASRVSDLGGEGYQYRSVMYGMGFSSRDNPGIWGGAWLHSRNGLPSGDNISSLIVMLGCEFGNYPKLAQANNTYRFGLSYDYNLSGLRSDGGGTVEASLVINFANATLMNCNRRFGRGVPCPKFN